MKTPINMLESIAADVVESTSLLEVIYRNNELPPEADNAIACLIRSMQKTNETAYEYVEQLSKNQVVLADNSHSVIDIVDDVLNAITSAKKQKNYRESISNRILQIRTMTIPSVLWQMQSTTTPTKSVRI